MPDNSKFTTHLLLYRKVIYWTLILIFPSDKPAPPGVPEIKMVKDQALLSWSAPRSDGGAPISNYRVERRTTGAYQWEPVNLADKVTDTKYTVREMADQTDYEFRILAENKAGYGRPSEVSKTAKYGEFIICCLGYFFLL